MNERRDFTAVVQNDLGDVGLIRVQLDYLPNVTRAVVWGNLPGCAHEPWEPMGVGYAQLHPNDDYSPLLGTKYALKRALECARADRSERRGVWEALWRSELGMAFQAQLEGGQWAPRCDCCGGPCGS